MVLILGALTSTIIMLAASFAIDLGGRALQKRRDHLVADLAALDAVRGVAVSAASVSTIASQSAARNGFGNSGETINVVRGHWDPTQPVGSRFTPETAVSGLPAPQPCPCDTVWVDAASTYNDFFRTAGGNFDAVAIAQPQNMAAFTIGSTLTQVNAGLGLFQPGAISMTAVGYNGLVTSGVTLGALAQALGLNTGLLTPDQILNSKVSVSQLIAAAASLLSANNPAAAADLTALGAAVGLTVTNTDKVTVGQAVGLASGQGAVLATTVNLLQAVSGGIEVANQEAGAFSGLAVTVPGITSATFSATGITPPRPSGTGPPYSSAASATDDQITGSITLNFGALGNMTVTAVIGGATGTLKQVDCPNNVPTDIIVGTTLHDAQLTVTGGEILDTPITGSLTVSTPNPADATVADPTNWSPTPPGVPKTASSTPTTASFSLGPPGSALTALLAVLTPAALATLISGLNGQLATLGVAVGSADYVGTNLLCGVPKLLQ